MFCKNCGSEIQENQKFCKKCGSPLLAETQDAVVLQQSNDYLQSKSSEYVTEISHKPKKQKNNKLVVVIIAITAVIAVIIGVTVFVTAKFNSPLVKIGRGIKKLVTSNEAYTYKISYDDGYDEYKISGDVKFDLKGKNIDATNINVNADGERVNIEAFLHIKDKEFGCMVDYGDDTDGIDMGNGIIYNGWSMYYEDDYFEGDNIFSYFSDDPDKFNNEMLDVISLLFDYFNGDVDIEQVSEQVICLIKNNFSNIEFNENPKIEFNSEIEKAVVKKLKKCLMDEEWLKENFGLSVSKDGRTAKYTFEIPIEKAIKAIYDIIEPLGKNVYNQLEMYYDLPSFTRIVNDIIYEIEDIDEKFFITICIEMKNNNINSIDINFGEYFYFKNSEKVIDDTVEINIEMFNTKKFNEPNINDYKKDINNAKEMFEKKKKRQESYYNGIKRKFIMGIDPNYPPFTYSANNGEYSGFDIEVCKAACEYLGWDFEIFAVNWDQKLVQLDAKECDCVWSGMTILPSMKDKGYIISNPYFENKQVFLVKEDSGISTSKDLVGKNIAVQLATSGESLLNSTFKTLADTFKQVIVCDSFSKCSTDLDDNTVDAVFIDQAVAKDFIEKNKGYKVIDENMGVENYGIAFRSTDQELCNQIESAIAALVNEGTYAKIAENYPDIKEYLIFIN